MEISNALQVVLFIASCVFILLTACLVPIAFHMRHQLKRLAQTTERLELNVRVLVRDSRELVQNLNMLTKQASQQIEDVGKVAHIVQQWTARADNLANEVASAIEPPVISVVQNMKRLQAGVAMFLRVLFHSGENKKIKMEEKNV